MLLDGFQAVQLGNHHVEPVILINLNLPPEERYLNENILLSCLIPGPKAPGDLNSFLFPMVEECKRLSEEGIDGVFNAFTKVLCEIRAHIIMVAGDGPALADVMKLKKPGNARSPCHHCKIKGTKKPNGMYAVSHTDDDIDNPVMRQNMKPALEQWNRLTRDEQNLLGTEHGISGQSILLQLPTLHFPGSFPLDLMHCVLLNQMRLLYKVLNGPNNSKTKTNNQQTALPIAGVPTSDQWKEISSLQEHSRKTIPTNLGRAPRSIIKYNKGYKAFEWEAFLERDGLVLLDQLGKGFKEHFKNFRLLRSIYRQAKQGPIEHSDLDKLRQNCRQYIRKFEKLYYNGDPTRLDNCRINTHALLHLGE
jgi:hypothetical protein